VHHGIDTGSFHVSDDPGEHLLYFGRIHPDKGTSHAIELAHRTGRRLDIAGIVQDVDYFRTHVEPHVDGEHIRYLGPIPSSQRAETLSGAHALVHLIDFDEPFGYSVVEAMACGTPVIAHARGSMPELIDDRRTGFLVTDIEGAVDATNAASSLDRTAIRTATVERFDVSSMVDQYITVYRTVIGHTQSGRGRLSTPTT
jgi:glycosyltransferase involved in cell wall biosynthesis